MKSILILTLAALAVDAATINATPEPQYVVDAYQNEVAFSDFLMQYLLALRYNQLRQQLEEKYGNGAGVDLNNRFGNEIPTDRPKPGVPGVVVLPQRPNERPGVPGVVVLPRPTQRPGAPGVTQAALTTQRPAQCKQVGERCVYHSECCSNACLFYLGKCVSG